ncbi:hypothetical protein BD779DRAFT_214387 [Infundibulicybe gibba]|nr:hypothetical protein BD779DRAFT_214387 [Infundibulicybe gibba]
MPNISAPKGAGAAVSRLPLEILSKIFIYCLPLDFVLQNIQRLRLSSVCGLWRAFALGTPALWASLDIECTETALRPPLSAIRAHLQRSGAHPLSFRIRARHSGYFYNARPHLPTAIKTLAAARQRWRYVHIELGVMTQDILDLIALGNAPLLQAIDCDVWELQQIPPIPLHALLRGCPRLESLSWKSFGSPLLQPLGDTQLTSLLLQATISVSECITLMRLSPRLSSAKFYISHTLDPSPAPHLIHPTLCTLTTINEHFDTLLASLTLPALESLDLTDNIWSDSSEIILSAFLERSNPTLHQLSISIMKDHEPALLHILALTPHLRGLRLHAYNPAFFGLTSAIICGLQPPPPPGTPLCPCLQSVYIHALSYEFPDGLCSAMLRARWGAQARINGVVCLKQVHIKINGGVGDRDRANMKELRAEGMQGAISLGYS